MRSMLTAGHAGAGVPTQTSVTVTDFPAASPGDRGSRAHPDDRGTLLRARQPGAAAGEGRQRAGHDVVVATGAELTDHVRRHGLPVWQVGRSRADVDARFRAANPDLDRLGFEQRVARMADGLFVQAADDRIPDLLAPTAEWRPDVVISETGELAGAVVAARTGARHVVHGVSTPPPRPLWDATFGAGYALALPLVGGARPAPRCPLPRHLAQEPGRRTVRVAAHAAPAAGRWSGRTRSAPAVGRPPAREDRAPHARHDLRRRTRGLGGGRGRAARAAGEPGRDGRSARRPGPVRPAAPARRIERYVPHELLLPACDLLVDHAGAGILLAGFRHGLPQLLLPQGIDQFGNAEAAERAGAGLALTEVTAEAVAGAAQRLLDEPGSPPPPVRCRTRSPPCRPRTRRWRCSADNRFRGSRTWHKLGRC